MARCLQILAIVTASGLVAPAAAEEVQYAVDPGQSSLHLETTVLYFGSPLTVTEQGPDSMVTTCSGVIRAELTPTTIQFLTGSVLVAGFSGEWRPGADYTDPNYVDIAEPANYGVMTDLSPLGLSPASPSAVRDLQIGLQHVEPKPLSAGEFDEAGIDTAFVDGVVTYSAGGSPPITDLVNTVSPNDTEAASGSATLASDGNTETLTLPFEMTSVYWINFLIVEQHFTGTIVATRNLYSPADLDRDGDVDGDDLNKFKACASGSAISHDGTPACEQADYDTDSDVDQADFGVFQRFIPG